MYLPHVPPLSNSQIYVKGDVIIDANATIAPGVIIQADPDSRILIASGVCIGMGSILHAHKGTLEVEAGAILGASVLVVGQGKIGANACIGAATTIWNSSVEAWQVIPAGSLLGDKGRQVAEIPQPSTESPQPSIEVSQPSAEEITEVNGHSPVGSQTEVDSSAVQPYSEEPAPDLKPSAPEPTGGLPVYGQASLNRLLITLFPHYKSANRPPEDD